VCVCVCDGHSAQTYQQLQEVPATAAFHGTHSFCLISTRTSSCLCSTALQSEQSMNWFSVKVSDCTEKL